jgi:K+-transporting ATPase KdpF subunit
MREIELMEVIFFVWRRWCKQKIPLIIFIILCSNLLLSPVVSASSGYGPLELRSVWAVSILGFVVVALIFYLCVVILQPERF